jgi:hypothetical protein
LTFFESGEQPKRKAVAKNSAIFFKISAFTMIYNLAGKIFPRFICLFLLSLKSHFIV